MSEGYESAWVRAGAQVTSPHLCKETNARPPRPPGERARAGSAAPPEGVPWYNCEIGQPPPVNPHSDSIMKECVSEWEREGERACKYTDAILRRIERYHLQATSREILQGVKDGKGRKFRVGTCLVCAQAERQFVGVHRKDGKGFYTNLQTCGSVWVCPVCAAKISESRRLELSGGLRKWQEAGGKVRHLIQTVRHHKGQSLEEVLEGIGKARKYMRNRKPWKKKVSHFLAGTVRALEVTYGDNGWHAHIHELLLIRPGLGLGEWLQMVNGLGEIGGMWRDACLTAGMGEPDPVHGIRIQNGQYAAAYAAKWGLECEITKAHIKQARGRGGYTPFDLLREYKGGDRGAKTLFREYALAFKGKRQLVWSEGLKALLGIVEASDEELAARTEEGDELGNLDLDTWRRVVKAKKRGELAAIAGARGWEGVIAFIRGLRCSGDPRV